MNTPVYIRQMSAISALGNSADALFSELMNKRSGIRETQRFDCKNYSSAWCATVPELDNASQGQAAFMLLEMLLEQTSPIPSDAHLILATTKGAIDQLQQQCRSEHTLEASTGEIHQTLTWLQKRFGITHTGMNINAACASSTIAIAKAAALIRNGLINDCVIVAYDLVTEFTQSGFSAIKAASDGLCRPFDVDRKGLNLGESAAFLHLSNNKQLQQDIPLVKILGSGISSDAAHITAPARDAAGLIRACKQAFNHAGVEADAVTGISAHGTGTVYNDAMEMTGFHSLFGGKIPPFFSIKGATGHTLGASGALETIVSILSLGHGLIPPTVGCKNPAPEAMGKAMESPQTLPKGVLLKTNSGFGGINAALLMTLES